MKKFLSIILIALLSIFLISAQDYSRYGMLNYRSGLQKVANICQADSNITIVAHYKFDEASGSLVDYSGNALDLTKSGSPTYQQADYLSLNRAITFTPGTSDYFSKADNAIHQVTTQDFIIWVIAKTSVSSGIMTLVDKYIGKGYIIKTHNVSNKLMCYLKDGDADSTATYSDDVVGDGLWKLYQINFDRSDKSHLYINSTLQADEDDITGIGTLTNAGNFSIGSSHAGGNYWDGSIGAVLVIKAASTNLPDWVMSATFAANAYNWSMKWPLNLPH